MARSFEWIPVTTLASGAELRVPLHTLAGAQPGPTLGLSALVHGNEPVPSIGIIRAVLERLDASELRGTLLAAPVLNPLGYAAMSRHTPEDGMNLNGAFIESDAGGHPEPVKTVSIQLATAISAGFLSKLDYQIDFHSGGNASVHMIEFTDDPESRAMARAFNMPILLRDVWMPGQMWTRAELARLPEAERAAWADPIELGKAFVWLAGQPPDRFSGLRFDAGPIAAEGYDFAFAPEKVTLYTDDFVTRQKWCASYEG